MPRATASDVKAKQKPGPAKTVEKGKSEWVPKATLALSALSFLVGSGIAVRSAIIEGKIKSVQASVAEFQAAGTLQYSYEVVDLSNYCASTEKPEDFHGDHISPANLYDGYVRNEIWEQAEKVIRSNACGTLGPGLEPVPRDPRLDYSLAYLTIASKSDMADPRVTLDVRRIPSAPRNKPIWQLQSLPGPEIEIPLGQLVKDRAVMIPVALIDSDGAPASPVITVPLRARWQSPVTKEDLSVPLTYIVDRQHWRSLRKGVTLSGA